MNRLGQSDPAPLQHDMDQYRKRFESFGFHAIVVDGHDVGELVSLLVIRNTVIELVPS